MPRRRTTSARLYEACAAAIAPLIAYITAALYYVSDYVRGGVAMECVAALRRLTAIVRSIGDVSSVDPRQLPALAAQLSAATKNLAEASSLLDGSPPSPSQQGAVVGAVVAALQALADHRSFCDRTSHVAWFTSLAHVLLAWASLADPCHASEDSEGAKQQLTACLQQHGEWTGAASQRLPTRAP
jgi:hypothetical protein